MRRLILVFVLLASFTAPALAQEMPASLAAQKARGAQVYYLGKFDTLDGWVMIRTGQPEFYYATPGNKALVMGILFDPEGNMLTGEQLKVLELSKAGGVVDMMKSQLPQVPDDDSVANLPAPTATAPVPNAASQAPVAPAPGATATPVPAPTPAAAAPIKTAAGDVPDTPAGHLLMDMRAANSVLWGKAGLPAFYAFVDPNCPHCQYFLKQVEPFVNAGEVAVHLILVGYNDKSRQQAALVLASGDGPQRLVAYAKGQADQLPAPEKISVDAVKANVDLMHDWDLTATPIIVYQAGKGGEIKLIRGRPLDMAGAVKDLKG